MAARNLKESWQQRPVREDSNLGEPEERPAGPGRAALSPLVSVVLIFLDAAEFLDEAIGSVVAQSYRNWELILVDDGSSDDSTAIARGWAESRPRQVRYLDHPGHENRGMSASRNRGLRGARGEFIALLDADDVWLPEKLTTQVGIMQSHPEVGIVYGASEYWFSWGPDAADTDWIQEHHIPSERVYQPPDLIRLFLRGAASIPCPSSVMFRAEAAARIGGFEESFPTLYEDQVFFSKMGLAFPAFVSGLCLDRYRQHSDSASAGAGTFGSNPGARARYLRWLRDYLREQHIDDPGVWEGLGMAFWMMGATRGEESSTGSEWNRWLRKWFVRSSAMVLPRAWSRRFWRRMSLFEDYGE